MPAEIDDHPIAQRAAGQPRPAAAGMNAEPGLDRRVHRVNAFVHRLRKRYRSGNDLIDGRVGREQLSRQGVDANVTRGFAKSRVEG